MVVVVVVMVVSPHGEATDFYPPWQTHRVKHGGRLRSTEMEGESR
jgi:hypothetical protein